VNTRRLVRSPRGGFLYDADYYGDELPFCRTARARGTSFIPYSADQLMRQITPGWVRGPPPPPRRSIVSAFVRDAVSTFCAGGKHGSRYDVDRAAHAAHRPSSAGCRLQRRLFTSWLQKDVWVTPASTSPHWREPPSISRQMASPNRASNLTAVPLRRATNLAGRFLCEAKTLIRADFGNSIAYRHRRWPALYASCCAFHLGRSTR